MLGILRDARAARQLRAENAELATALATATKELAEMKEYYTKNAAPTIEGQVMRMGNMVTFMQWDGVVCVGFKHAPAEGEKHTNVFTTMLPALTAEVLTHARKHLLITMQTGKAYINA